MSSLKPVLEESRKFQVEKGGRTIKIKRGRGIHKTFLYFFLPFYFGFLDRQASQGNTRGAVTSGTRKVKRRMIDFVNDVWIEINRDRHR